MKFELENAYVSFEKMHVGLINDVILEGKTRRENILTIHYDVVTNGITESYSKTVELAPGKKTDVIIDY